MRNGAVKIKGKNIVIEADEDVDIKAGRNITLDAKQRILLKGTRCDAKGILGNLIPDKQQFGSQVFAGTFVGLDFLSGKGMMPGIPNVLGTAGDIAMGAISGAASGGIGGIVQGAANLATNNLTKGLPIDQVADVALHGMQDPLKSAGAVANIITDVGTNEGYGDFGQGLDNAIAEDAEIANEDKETDDPQYVDDGQIKSVNETLNSTFELY